MDYLTLHILRRNHPAWRLLAAEHAPLIASFLHRVFIKPNVHAIAEQELASRLQDYLYLFERTIGRKFLSENGGELSRRLVFERA